MIDAHILMPSEKSIQIAQKTSEILSTTNKDFFEAKEYAHQSALKMSRSATLLVIGLSSVLATNKGSINIEGYGEVFLIAPDWAQDISVYMIES